MIPALPDTGADGTDPTAHRIPFDAWDLAIINEIIEARHERRPVPFKIPTSDHGDHS